MAKFVIPQVQHKASSREIKEGKFKLHSN